MIAHNGFLSGLTKVHYGGNDISMVYYGNHKVFPDDTPPGPTPTGWVSYQSGGTFTGNEKIGGIRISLEEATRLMDIEDYYGEITVGDGAIVESSFISIAVSQSEGRIIGEDGEDIPLVDGYFTLTLDNTKEWHIHIFDEEFYPVPPYPVPFNCDLLIRE